MATQGTCAVIYQHLSTKWMKRNWITQQQTLQFAYQLISDACFALGDTCYISKQTRGMHASLENEKKD